MEEDPEYKKAQRRRYTKSRFGISLEQREEMLKEQSYKCKICAIELPSEGFLTHLDHSHKTGKIRAFLCTNCNRGLGHFKDSSFLLRTAAQYLEEFI